MKSSISVIKLCVFVGNALVPLLALVLFLLSKRSLEGFLILVFICFAIIERAWETFKTSKEEKREEYHGDWTLVAVTATYLALFFIFTIEYYLSRHALNNYFLCFGMALWLLAFRLRIWGMVALGKQWAVHAVNAQQIKKVRLIELGPYKYVRHPIYASIIVEELSFPIIVCAPWALIFALVVCIPLVLVRAFLEEKTSCKKFGESYLNYKNKTGMFLPKARALFQ